MMMAGPMEMMMLLMLGGGFSGGGILGLPPGERDAAFVQCPASDVPLYTEWASRGKGKPGGPGIDGLAADPEVLAFIEALDQGIQKAIELNAGGDEEKVMGEHIPPLVKILLNRPGCLYIDADAKAAMQLMANPPELPRFTPPFFAMLPAFEATMIVNGGDQSDEIAKHLEGLMELLPVSERVKGLQHQQFPIPMEGASLTLHRHKNYFILGWGKGTVDAAIKGLTGDNKGLKDNPRFQASMEKVALERTANIAWFDMKSLIDKAVKGLGPQGLVVAAVAQQLGADSIDSLALCTGVVKGQIHTKGFLKTDGKTEGILALAAGRPLTAKDFQNVPADADLVFAFTLDAPKILGTTKKLIAQAGDEPKENFDKILSQLETELGLSFEDDIFKAFGQKWMIYDSPSNGGILLSAPVLALEVKDYETAQKTFEQLMKILKLAVPGETRAGRFGRGIYLSKKSFLDQEIYYINTIGDDVPFTPSFTLTKTHLLASPHPQQIKAHLRFLKTQEARFSEKAFEEKIQHAGGELFAVSYTRPELFARYLATISPFFASVAFSEIQRGMPGFDAFDFPSARALLPYFGEGLLTKERTEDGILFDARHGVPIPGMSSIAITMPVFGFMSFVRVRAIQRGFNAAPARIQINRFVPKRPVNKVRPQAKPTPRTTAS